MAPELFKSPVEMVANVPKRLPPFLGDLGQCVALKKMQPERLPLVGTKALHHLAQPGPPNHSFERLLILRGCCSPNIGGFCNSIHVSSASIARSQLYSALQRLMIDRLNDPRAGRAPRRIIDVALSIDVKKDVLDEVVRFSGVAKNPSTNTIGNSSIPPEQNSKRFTVPQTNAP